MGIDIKKNKFYFIGIINDFNTNKYSDEIEELTNQNIFLLNENDIKKVDKNLFVNYSEVDKHIESMKSDIKNMKSDIKNIKTNIEEIQKSINSLIETIKPNIEDYRVRSKNNLTQKYDS